MASAWQFPAEWKEMDRRRGRSWAEAARADLTPTARVCNAERLLRRRHGGVGSRVFLPVLEMGPLRSVLLRLRLTVCMMREGGGLDGRHMVAL